MESLSIKSIFRLIWIAVGPLVCLLINISGLELISPEADKVISVALWMVIWWISEPFSISVTALLPLVMFPLLGIMPLSKVTVSYGSPIIFLFFGGFILALAMEKVNLHKRIALQIILWTGSGRKGILLGFILSTALLSMWISNTATALVILPIALTIINFLQERDISAKEKEFGQFKIACMIGIAYAANIGGTATIIGTPPNVVLIGYLEDHLGREMDFLQWVYIALPFTLVMLTATYFLLIKVFRIKDDGSTSHKGVIQQEIKNLGKMRGDEVKVTVSFGITILLWVFRTQFNELTGLGFSNAIIAMIGAMLVFLIPDQAKTKSILEWEDTKHMQWGILILFGGGLALASAFSEANIIELIGQYVKEEGFTANTTTPFLITVMLFMTELMSNVALVNIFAPILSGIADGLGVDFLTLGIPTALASSCAFMLPMSTPPNAIVYSSGYVKVFDMMKTGIILNILAVLLLIVLSLFWIDIVL